MVDDDGFQTQQIPEVIEHERSFVENGRVEVGLEGSTSSCSSLS